MNVKNKFVLINLLLVGMPRPEVTWFKDGIELYHHKYFQVSSIYYAYTIRYSRRINGLILGSRVDRRK